MDHCAVLRSLADGQSCGNTSTNQHSQAPDEPIRAPFATQSATHFDLSGGQADRTDRLAHTEDGGATGRPYTPLPDRGVAVEEPVQAKSAKLRAAGDLAAPAPMTGAAEDDRVDRDPLAHLRFGDAVANRHNAAGELVAENDWRAGPGDRVRRVDRNEPRAAQPLLDVGAADTAPATRSCTSPGLGGGGGGISLTRTAPLACQRTASTSRPPAIFVASHRSPGHRRRPASTGECRSRTGPPRTAGHLAHRALLDSDSRDDQPGFRHPGSLTATGSLTQQPLRQHPASVLDVLRHPSSMS